MKVSMKVEDPKVVPITLTLTMTLYEWATLREQLSGKWPSWQVSCAISKAVARVTEHFTEEVDEDV